MWEVLSDVLIVGAGPAGLTAAMYACRAGMKALVAEKLVPGGQMGSTPEIANYPGVPDTSGWALTELMRGQAKALGAEIRTAEATGFDFAPGDLAVLTTDGPLTARAIILALGARRRTLGIPGEAEFTGRGVSYCATCDGNFFKGRDVAVVGGGNTALEDALYLAGLCRGVTLIHRRDAFRGGRVLEERVRATPNITLCLNAVPTRVEGSASAEAVTLRDCVTGQESRLAASALFVAVGTVPETELLRGLLPLDAQGRVLAGEDTKTPVAGVFVAGDMRAKPLYQIVTATADGAVAATAAFQFLQENPHETG